MVESNDVQDIEELAFVLVQSFDLNVKQRRRVDFYTAVGDEPFRQTPLVGLLDVAPLSLQGRILGEWQQLLQVLQIAQPRITDAGGDERRKIGIALEKPTSWGDTIRLVVELLGHQLGEVREDTLAQNAGVQLGDTVDRKTADDGQVGHAHPFFLALSDERHATDPAGIVTIASTNVVEKTLIDFEDDLQVTRQHLADQARGPTLECLGQDGVICVGKTTAADIPRLVPRHAVFINKNAHQLRHGDRRMGVIELEDRFVS